MNPPPNPHAAESRADIMKYNAAMLMNPPADDAPPEPPLSTGLDRIVAQWPDMARYYKTAKIEKLYHPGGWCWGVTVTVCEAAKAAEGTTER